MAHALLVLDVNNEIVNAEGKLGADMGLAAHAASRGVPAKVRRAVESARAAGVPVAWAYPDAKVLASFGVEPSNEWGIAIDAEYGEPADGETVYAKQAVGAMTDTTLADDLRAISVDTVLLCGVATTYVVAQTAAEAIERGFAVKVLEDCCSDAGDEEHAAALAALPDGVDVVDSASVL
jgi:nicotinamidase-related amidase